MTICEYCIYYHMFNTYDNISFKETKSENDWVSMDLYYS